MFKSFIVFLLLWPAMGQLTAQDLINWHSDVLLKPSDFKAKPEKNSRYAAFSEVGLSLAANQKGGEFTWEVLCYFNPAKSWMKNDTMSLALLQHEQLHFDICELSARKLRKALSQYKEYPKGKALENLMNRENQSQDAMQSKYDRETNHGIIEEKQREWQEFVAKELKKLDKFK